jgi:hypothetical protein
MSDWLFSKSPLEAAAVFKKAAKFVDLLASNNMFIVEGANPANWYVHEDSRLPIFIWPHFILTRQQNEMYVNSFFYFDDETDRKNLRYRSKVNVLG